MTTVYGFEKGVARDILQNTYGPDGQQTSPRRGPLSRAAGVWMMEATSAITAATTTTPGSGTAKIKWRNPTTNAFEDWTRNGAIVERTVYTMTTPLPSGWLFKAEQDNLGTIWLDKILNATRYRGLINDASGFATNDPTTAMDGLIPLNGVGVETTLATVYNIHDWGGDDNANARAEWNADDEQWELYMVDCQ